VREIGMGVLLGVPSRPEMGRNENEKQKEDSQQKNTSGNHLGQGVGVVQ